MFPTLSHLIEYFTGVFIPLPIQTFGLFLSLSFVSAYYAFKYNFNLNEKRGLVFPIVKERWVGKPMSISEYMYQAIMLFIIGFKLGGIVFNYTAFYEDPPGYIFSTKGNIWIGLALTAIMIYVLRKNDKKNRLTKPKKIKETLPASSLTNPMLIWSGIGGLLGAKFFHNLEYWDQFVKDPIGEMFAFSGLTFYGGLIVGGAVVLYIAKKHRISPLKMIDIAAPGMMLAYAVGRLGCHLSGDGDWGIENLSKAPAWMPDWFWSFTYPHNVINAGMRMADCTGQYCYELVQPVYPTPLYESLICFVLFGILTFMAKKISTVGVVSAAYLLMNGLERFFIERIRVNAEYNAFGMNFTQAELVSILLIVFSLVIFSKIWIRKRA